MLTVLILSIQPRWWHRIMWLLGVRPEDFHWWIEGLCPCGEDR